MPARTIDEHIKQILLTNGHLIFGERAESEVFEEYAEGSAKMINARILAGLLAELPEKRNVMAEPPDEFKGRPHAIAAVRDYQSGYNVALAACIEAINKYFGAGEEHG